ncbi:MAG: dihydropteroate synthase [Actinomycetota bacterium]|nr:dihydropteroate synthase [Actinomycetota bacterium]
MKLAHATLEHAKGGLSLDRCAVMGIVNRTTDSFYDPGRMELEESIAHGLDLWRQGALVLDVGGVKAGPGPEIEEAEERRRVIPLVQGLAARSDALISVETGRVRVAEAALQAGAAIVNDVTALADERIAGVCAEYGAALVLMHNGGQLRGRPRNPRYDDVVTEVRNWWAGAVERACAAGLRRNQLLLDPGLDFGKTTYHSLELVRRMDELTAQDCPVLFAPSRKDLVGESLALPPGDRLEGSLAVAALCVERGAAMVRAHDVLATERVVAMVETVLGRRRPRRAIRGLWE